MKVSFSILGISALRSATLIILTAGALLGFRACGFLQRSELFIYDNFVRHRAYFHSVTDSNIVICGMTEADIITYGHPLDDGKLATLLETICAAKPCVVGLDIFRDLKEPRSGEFYFKLADTLLKFDNIVAIEHAPTIGPPPALAGKPGRVAPVDTPADVDGITRRAYLFLEEDTEAQESLPLVLAHKFLAEHNVAPALIETPGGTAPLLRLGKITFPRLTSNAGGYFGQDIRGYETMVDYRSPQRYRTYSFDDVLKKRVPAAALKDAIVIIGVTAESVPDDHITPVNDRLRGTVHIAMIVNQFLRSALRGEQPTIWWSETVQIAWIVICTMLGGICGLKLGSPGKFLLGLSLTLTAILFSAWSAFVYAVWIPIATPLFGALAAASLVFLDTGLSTRNTRSSAANSRRKL